MITPEQMQRPQSEITFNPQVKLIVSDVDETIADLYVRAEPAMMQELTSLLEEEKRLFLVSGAGLQRIRNRVVDHLPAHLRRQVLVAHCSGAEVWGFTEEGDLRETPFYSVYDSVFDTEEKKQLWRKTVEQLEQEFKLDVREALPVKEFTAKYGTHPLTVMKEDRGPQITLEVANGYQVPASEARALGFSVPEGVEVYDIRDAMLPRALELFQEAGLPVTPRLGGEFAVDFAVEGINKTKAVEFVLGSEKALGHIGLAKEDLIDPNTMEVWGDKFSISRGGTDRHMCEALPQAVRAIDFREENKDDVFPNVVIWNGKEHLHHGLLEYLQSRHT